MSKEKTMLSVRVPTSVLARVKAKLHDPVYGRTQYGAMNTLVTRLLMNWLEDGEHDPKKPQLDLNFSKKDTD